MKRGKKIKPEIIQEKEVSENKSLVKYKEEKPLAEPIYAPSSFPFLNRLNLLKIKSFQRVVEAGTSLFDALGDHEKAKARLSDVENEIEAEQIERLNRLRDVQREAKLTFKKDKIAQLELEVKEVELQERLKQLKTPPEEENKIQKLKAELKEKILEKEAYQDFNIDKLKLDFRKELKTQQVMDEVFNEVVKDFLKGRDPEELEGEERQKLENLQDFYYKILDRE